MAKVYVDKAIRKKKIAQENYLRKGTLNNKFKLRVSKKELKRVVKLMEGLK